MTLYHKIQTVFKRDPETKFKNLLMGEYTLPEFEFLKDATWVFTEKVDGTNIRIECIDGKLTFKGRTEKATLPPFLEVALSEIFEPLLSQFKALFEDSDVCLYGEGYGDKIQKVGKLYRDDQSFVLFDVRVGSTWLRRADVEDIAHKLKLEIVPIIGEGTLDEMVTVTRDGFKSIWGDFTAEGIVARPKVELATRNGSRIITKLKHSDFK